ncbi:MAG: hypothetical protein HY908_08495, partial [Myxococcales bacterium]|nr:hypothetical protein [Myxococcales bacterium]
GAAGGQLQGGGGSAPTVALHVHAEDALSETALADVTVCVPTAPGTPCAQSNAQGDASFALAPGPAIYVSLVKDGYAHALLGSLLGAGDLSLTAPLVANGLANLVAQSAGVTLDPAKAQIALAAVATPPSPGAAYPGVEGVTFTLAPGSGSGPHYGNAINLIDPALTATSSRGAALYFNVDPGDYVVTASHPTATCTAMAAIPGAVAGTFDVWTDLGFVTYVSLLCESGGAGGGSAGGSGGAGAGGAGGTGGG